MKYFTFRYDGKKYPIEGRVYIASLPLDGLPECLRESEHALVVHRRGEGWMVTHAACGFAILKKEAPTRRAALDAAVERLRTVSNARFLVVINNAMMRLKEGMKND